MKVLIIDYGLCNIDSVYRAVQECRSSPVVSSDPVAIREASKVILPGVGNFSQAMKVLKEQGWVDAIREEVLGAGIPLLGICLGMQLLASDSTEGGFCEGLNLIPGHVRLLDNNNRQLRIPHVGWNEVHQAQAHPFFDGISDKKDYYFVHSYQLLPENESHILARTPYEAPFVSVIGSGHIVGTQFHPEKSLRSGFSLFENFLKKV